MAVPWLDDFERVCVCDKAYTRPLALTGITFVLSVSTTARTT